MIHCHAERCIGCVKVGEKHFKAARDLIKDAKTNVWQKDPCFLGAATDAINMQISNCLREAFHRELVRHGFSVDAENQAEAHLSKPGLHGLSIRELAERVCTEQERHDPRILCTILLEEFFPDQKEAIFAEQERRRLQNLLQQESQPFE